MIHTFQGSPDIGGVTVLADVGAADVIGTFTFGDDTVMAGGTGLGDLLVIKVGRCPGRGAVTVVALCIGWQMIVVFACSNDSVVATVTGTQYLQVVNLGGRLPYVGSMTIFTHIG